MIVVVALLAVLSQHSISPVDIIFGRERTVARQQLPTGGLVEVFQYWNNGDFYNLNLRHTTKEGVLCECVIDPDCLRVPYCQISFDTNRAEAIIASRKNVLARYRWAKRELIRKNGSVVECQAVEE